MMNANTSVERVELVGGLNALAARVGRDYEVTSTDGEYAMRVNLEHGHALIRVYWDGVIPF